MAGAILNKVAKGKLKKSIHLSTVSDRFERQRVVFESPQAIAHDAEDIIDGGRVYLWTLRKPAPTGLADKLVKNVLTPALSCGLPAPKVLQYGSIGDNNIFYSTQQVSASSLLSQNVATRKKSLFAARMVRIIAHLHEAGVVLGCLHSGSVLITRDDYFYFNGFLPVIDSKAISAIAKSTQLEFAAPELRLSGKLNAASDVFSLGAYLYRFLSGHEFPAHLDEQQLYQHLRIQLPLLCSKENRVEWLQPILHKMLQWRPEKRYANANDVFADVSEACPNLGVFGAGTLKSIDNAAASYIMSPFTRIIVGAVVLGGVFAVVHKNTQQGAASLQLLDTPSRGANIQSVSDLHALGSSETTAHSDGGNNGFFNFGSLHAGAGVEEYKGKGAFHEVGRSSNSNSNSKNAKAAVLMPSKPETIPSPMATNSLWQEQRVSPSKSENQETAERSSSSNGKWKVEDDSSLMHVLRYGSVGAQLFFPYCSAAEEQ